MVHADCVRGVSRGRVHVVLQRQPGMELSTGDWSLLLVFDWLSRPCPYRAPYGSCSQSDWQGLLIGLLWYRHAYSSVFSSCTLYLCGLPGGEVRRH
jgi:hypothetical protein